MKTVTLEDLAPEAQQIVAGWLTEQASINFAREGHLYTEFFDADENISFEITLEEEELLEDIRQGDAEFAAGDCISLDDFKVKYADRLKGRV